MPALFLILYLLAAGSLLGAAVGVVVHPRVNLFALGMLFWLLVAILRAAGVRG